MYTEFIIEKNEFLGRDVRAYYHQVYTGFKQPNNPDFLNTLKNTFNNTSYNDLVQARNSVIHILLEDIPSIVAKHNMTNCMLICVPRAKSLNAYSKSQLMLKEAVSVAANNIGGIIDGTDCITRIINTRTTHLRNATSIPNDGDEPYPGITGNTCRINRGRVVNRNIILIDDIYTKSVNIDEDCIQELLNNGSHTVIFYSIGYTRRNS